jgi:hypothetical protein
MNQKMNQWAEQAKSLFPADATMPDGTTRHQFIDGKLQNALNIYDPAIAKTCESRFLADMNTQARIAYRRGYQSEIREIK